MTARFYRSLIKDPLKNFLMASLVIHAAFAVSLSLFTVEPSMTEKIEISLRDAPESKTTVRKSLRTKKSSERPSSGNRSVNLKDLGFGSSTANLLKGTGSNDTLSRIQDSVDWKDPNGYLNNDFDAFDGYSAREIKYTATLWRKIDQAIESPSYLSEYNHTGKIHLKFEIDEKGFLKEDKLRACGENNVLKVLAVRALRKAVSEGGHELQDFAADTKFYAQFSWADRSSCRTLKGITKNRLSFCHYAENKRKDFSTAEKTTTYLNALTYGPGMLEEIEKYRKQEKHREHGFDPFAQLKNDPDWNLGCS